jgi:hypothetical protein
MFLAIPLLIDCAISAVMKLDIALMSAIVGDRIGLKVSN